MCCAMVNFIRNHIKGRAEMLEPLTRLTKDNEPWAWKEEQVKAFEDSKRAIGEAVLLTHPRVDKEFILCLDASDFQIGA